MQNCQNEQVLRELIDFHVKSMSDQFGTIPQHEKSLLESSKISQKLRNLEKHDFCDEIGSPGFWGTLKINFRSADAANLVDRDPRTDME